MLNLVSVLLALFSLSAGFSLISHNCRQCLGSQIITFSEPASTDEAYKFFKLSLHFCGVESEFNTLAIKKQGCIIRGSVQACTSYEYDLRFWRYCGKGPNVYVDRGARCLEGICATSDIRKLTCGQQVKCYYVCPTGCWLKLKSFHVVPQLP